MAVPGTRRERVRALTVGEIKATARRLLVDQGAESVTLRAIAREMGMTAPALYRYFDGHEDLLRAVVADIYDEVAQVVLDAADAVGTKPGARLREMARAFRRWGIDHRREFTLLFATPVGGASDLPSPLDKANSRFGLAFVGAFFAIWCERPFPVAADDELPPALAAQLREYRARLAERAPDVAEMPLGAFNAFIGAWVQLYGWVAIEVFDHLAFALSDAGPAFETHMAGLGRALGMDLGDDQAPTKG